jgi:hypothetical protein
MLRIMTNFTNKKNRIVFIIIVSFVVLLFSFLFLIFSWYFYSSNKSDQYQIVDSFARKNDTISSSMGVINKLILFEFKTVEWDGSGEGQFGFFIVGENKKGILQVEMDKGNNKWSITEANLAIPKTQTALGIVLCLDDLDSSYCYITELK